MLEHHAYTLSGEGALDVVVLVVEVVVSLEANVAVLCEQILYIEVAYEVGVSGIHRVVAVAEVAVEEQSVVEQLARQSKLHLDVTEVALVAAEVRRYAPVFAELTEYAAQLR